MLRQFQVSGMLDREATWLGQGTGLRLDIRKDDQQIIAKSRSMEKDAQEKVTAALRRSFEIEEARASDGGRYEGPTRSS